MEQHLAGHFQPDPACAQIEDRFRIKLTDRRAVRAFYVIRKNFELRLRVYRGVIRKQQVAIRLFRIGFLCLRPHEDLGSVTLRDLNREYDWNLPDEEASTLAGLVLHEARQIPIPGQVFSFYGLQFEILDRQRNQIRRIRVTPLEESDAPSAAATNGK